MAGEQFKHVIEEANAGGDLVLAAAFDGERQGDMRVSVVLRTTTAVRIAACGVALMALRDGVIAVPSLANLASVVLRTGMACCICWRVPMVMRTRPSQPGSLERSRTRTPRCAHQAHKLGMLRPDFNEDKVGVTGPAANCAASSADSKSARAASTSPTYQSI